MLKLYNKEHKAIGVLTNLKDYKIEYVLSGEDLLEFSLSISDENIHLVEEEGYVRNKNNEYVIKAIDPAQEFKRYSCVVNIEDIKGKSIANFDTSNNNITDTIRLAIAGTGWVLADNNISKRRTVRLKNTNALEVLREIRKVFRVDFRFDAINKMIYVYEEFGEDKGVYFSDELNLKSFSIPSDTYDYATRIYPYGKDGLNISSINNGKEYIDNFQYSNKIIETIWEDNRYTDVNSLKEDAQAKLDELSKPKRSYQADIVDLAKQSEEYSYLDFFLGDTITLLSKQEKFRDKQRIVKYIEYPNEHDKNTCELGNTTLTFEELQKENEAKNQVVDNITSDNGTLDGSKVDNITTDQISDFEASVGKITDLTAINIKVSNLEAQNVTITGKLNAIEGEFGTLKANVGVIDKLTVTHTAQINDLKANSATITQLEAVSAKIGTVEAEVGKIQTLVNGNLSSENIQAGGITSDKLTITNGFITNAMIANLDVSKINAGDISTNKFKIKSDDGGIEIVGATQQFKDKNNKVRVQIGKDSKGNFNFIIRGENGTTTLIDHTGVKADAIADDLIVSDMISSDAVGEKQINYSSFATGFNKDTNTNTIKSTKIHLNNQNQTLEVAFNSLKTQADGTKSLTESHSTTIRVMQGQITTAINNTQIVKNGQTILLKDDYNKTVATVDSMKSTIGSHTTTLDQHTWKITGVETRVNTVERDLNSITQRVSSTETKVTTVTNTANTANSNATNALNTANSANSKIDGLEIGGENLVPNSDFYITTGSKTGLDMGIYKELFEKNRGKKITCSLDVKLVNAIGNSTGRQRVGMEFSILYKDGTRQYIGIWEYLTTTPKTINTRISGTTTISNKEITSIESVGVYIQGASGSVQAGRPQVELGSKASSWKKSTRDVDTEISSTKSKVSSIEANLSGITQRVSTVEEKQTTTDGKVTSLETWKKSAEVKITDSAIVSTVTKSATYKNDLNGKVSSNSIISSINQTAEAIKIDASKVNLNGYVTMTNLSTPGATIIDGRNIKTGFIEAIQLIAPHVTGKSRMYLEEGSVFSSDGETNVKNFYGMPNGTFNVESEATFGGIVNSPRFRCNGNYVPYSKSGYKWVIESLQGIGVGSGDAIEFQMVGGTKFGVDLWYIGTSSLGNLTTKVENSPGIDVINQLRYEDEGALLRSSASVLEYKDSSIPNEFTYEIEQDNGEVIRQVSPRLILPHVTLAIQQQSEIIKKLEERIAKLEGNPLNMSN